MLGVDVLRRLPDRVTILALPAASTSGPAQLSTSTLGDHNRAQPNARAAGPGTRAAVAAAAAVASAASWTVAGCLCRSRAVPDPSSVSLAPPRVLRCDRVRAVFCLRHPSPFRHQTCLAGALGLLSCCQAVEVASCRAGHCDQPAPLPMQGRCLPPEARRQRRSRRRWRLCEPCHARVGPARLCPATSRDGFQTHAWHPAKSSLIVSVIS